MYQSKRDRNGYLVCANREALTAIMIHLILMAADWIHAVLLVKYRRISHR
ncbi:hypothetical protein [Paenibacillus ihbetae]|nr:hypothetical protein [Paenibacillus ihbetae]